VPADPKSTPARELSKRCDGAPLRIASVATADLRCAGALAMFKANHRRPLLALQRLRDQSLGGAQGRDGFLHEIAAARQTRTTIRISG